MLDLAIHHAYKIHAYYSAFHQTPCLSSYTEWTASIIQNVNKQRRMTHSLMSTSMQRATLSLVPSRHKFSMQIVINLRNSERKECSAKV